MEQYIPLLGTHCLQKTSQMNGGYKLRMGSAAIVIFLSLELFCEQESNVQIHICISLMFCSKLENIFCRTRSTGGTSAQDETAGYICQTVAANLAQAGLHTHCLAIIKVQQ